MEDEWKHEYPNLKNLTTLLVKIAIREHDLGSLTPKDVKNILLEAKERILTASSEEESLYSKLIWVRSYFPNDDDPAEIVSILYRLGILGVRSKQKDIYVFEFDEMPQVTGDTKFMFHPMLHRIPIGSFQFKEENPWQ
ncbi:hypothetical protein IQ273_21135 [Nodosilinea sp. LEGE 07298]|uniref:hypothetical protein n=1 Tax=Nodosilinea sp. LEGE 07298 TaxID=2777970 RepID=UPI001880FADA|nr:hypothetical protein [Nodosilinea sp. LEGE 07298]MBE9111914.1 hypothetical protein [Nodosilinea sp. LEGE 07298]